MTEGRDEKMAVGASTNRAETKAERFERMAPPRVDKVINALRLLGNLSNRSNYSYTDEQVKEMFRAIDSALRETESKFKTGTKARSGGFAFKSSNKEDLLHGRFE